MVQFMVQYVFIFIIGYQIYQVGVYVNVIVCYCLCVDIVGYIDFIVNWCIVNVVIQCFGDFVQMFGVFVF